MSEEQQRKRVKVHSEKEALMQTIHENVIGQIGIALKEVSHVHLKLIEYSDDKTVLKQQGALLIELELLAGNLELLKKKELDRDDDDQDDVKRMASTLVTDFGEALENVLLQIHMAKIYQTVQLKYLTILSQGVDCGLMLKVVQELQMEHMNIMKKDMLDLFPEEDAKRIKKQLKKKKKLTVKN